MEVMWLPVLRRDEEEESCPLGPVCLVCWSSRGAVTSPSQSLLQKYRIVYGAGVAETHATAVSLPLLKGKS